MQVNVSHVSYCYPSSINDAVKDVSVSFSEGWTGIVGDNGSGKSTLARIACGLVSPDSGSVSSGLFSYYCDQDCSMPPSCIEEFACSYEKDAIRIRSLLNIQDEWLWNFETLSCGQQKRVQVACALYSRPDVLVVDEPTNHVDCESWKSIESALKLFRGVGLLISHDRKLLDSLCVQCLFMKDGSATLRPGSYSQGCSQSDLERESTIRARENAKRELSRLKSEANKRAEQASRTAGRRSARNLSKHDSDGRERIRLAVFTGQDGKAGKLSQRMDSRVAKAEQSLSEIRVEKRYKESFWIDSEPSPRSVLYRTDGFTLLIGGPSHGKAIERGSGSEPEKHSSSERNLTGYSGESASSKSHTIESSDKGEIASDSLMSVCNLDKHCENTIGFESVLSSAENFLEIPKLHIGNTDHIALVSPNGWGKTTFLNHVVKQLSSRNSCLFLPQGITEAQKLRVISKFKELNNDEKGRVLSVISQLNSNPDAILDGGNVSPGELKKLMLALATLDEPEIIVMDEPTNHLDIGSIVALEHFLEAFPGALLLVSHDEAFLESVANITWNICTADEGHRYLKRVW